MKRLLLILATLAGGCAAPTRVTPADPPPRYACPRVTTPVTIDGHIDEPAWEAAAWSGLFRDIEGDIRPAPRHDTRMKMIWTDEALYVAARLEEPHVCGFLANRDDIVYHDNDFEVFIDPDGDTLDYYEIEINALNTVMDLLMDRPYNEGGTYDLRWDLAGLESAVHVEGTVNDPTDTDDRWFVEMRLPWDALAEHAGRDSPPRSGDEWRMSFSRVQWRYDVVDDAYVKTPRLKEDNWTWSSQGAVNMHIPERWGYVRFTE